MITDNSFNVKKRKFFQRLGCHFQVVRIKRIWPDQVPIRHIQGIPSDQGSALFMVQADVSGGMSWGMDHRDPAAVWQNLSVSHHPVHLDSGKRLNMWLGGSAFNIAAVLSFLHEHTRPAKRSMPTP